MAVGSWSWQTIRKCVNQFERDYPFNPLAKPTRLLDTSLVSWLWNVLFHQNIWRLLRSWPLRGLLTPIIGGCDFDFCGDCHTTAYSGNSAHERHSLIMLQYPPPTYHHPLATDNLLLLFIFIFNHCYKKNYYYYYCYCWCSCYCCYYCCCCYYCY